MFFGNDAAEVIDGGNTFGLTGSGVGIAVLDTGISPVNDFVAPKNRIAAFKDFVNGRKFPYDDNGHGTHVMCAVRVSTKSKP